MKKSIFVLLFAFSATILCAQKKDRSNKIFKEKEEVEMETFNRKGRILIETGYNLFGGLPIGGATGLSSISEGEDTFSGLGFNGGYFISQNFALKLNYSNLGDGGTSITSLAIGAKYYIIGQVPIDVSLGRFGTGGNNTSFGTFTVGYGIGLADNINLEPSIGFFGNEDDAITTFNVNFSMFL